MTSARRADSVERTLGIFQDTWTFMVLREAFFGVRRFDDFQRNLGISRNVLTKRLRHLVDQGVFERRRYQSRPERFEYRLTDRGHDLYGIFAAMMRWGDDWLSGEAGPPLLLRHERCGSVTTPQVVCSACGEEIRARDMRYAPGPGAAT